MAGSGSVTGVKAAGPDVSKRQQYFAFGLVTSLFFLWGFSYGLLDVLNKHFQTFFGITKLQSTMIQVAYFGAYVVYSPVCGQFISKFGYKKGIYMGLGLYCIGALGFWPSAKFQKYGGFVASAFIIACGLATLEVCANSYVTVLGSPEQAAFRLNFSQSFNGLASFVGPLIASKFFFGDEKAQNSLGAVQWVYLAVACMGASVMVLFSFATLPEISENDMSEQQAAAGYVDDRPLYKRRHTVFGFLTQWMYVGAQVNVATFAINYLTDKNDFTTSRASQLFGFMQITFMVGRFASTPLLRIFNPATILAVYGAMCSIFTLIATLKGGKTGLACLFIVFFFESVCYPTTFTLATCNLGKWTKRGGSLIVMGVGGGAMFPPIQGAIADHKGTQVSYIIPFIGFLCVFAYGLGMRWYLAKFDNLVPNLDTAIPMLGRIDSDKASTEVKAEPTEFRL
ncbi:BZ3500_MvSof-1268-A1-R1_Chr2-1g04440 [Microbotryum saponariae]|uniref:BZ3500_MvSof-1268-A1-R1_Chr2-1g04440 protein n=1 Tax=Microbotryum saponariae TaxID=289078 RepID=A0A2X0KZ46_9BASI|nr:BZ3500_MvSof-1268-A1-R1_Chr2-1g04440 [Microbotryum saponariae]SCZ91712.1 BZ3501_MvSof-1269-A2-R1_Chr2-1g04096 [Microbotryum saponariae]